MDTEGAEWLILKGAKDIMSQRSIVFQVEFHWDEDWHQRSIIEELGYNVYTSKDWMGGKRKSSCLFRRTFLNHAPLHFASFPRKALAPTKP